MLLCRACFQRYAASTAAAATTTTAAVRTAKAAEGKNEEWKSRVMKKLDRELKEKNEARRRESKARDLRSHIIRLTLTGDFHKMITVANEFSFLDSKTTNELAALIGLCLHRHLISTSSPLPRHPSTDSIIFAYLSLLHQLRLLNEDSFNVAVLLQKPLREYAAGRDEDKEVQAELHRRLDAAKNRLQMTSLMTAQISNDESSVFLNDKHKKIIRQTLNEWNVQMKKISMQTNSGYAKDLELVSGLESPCQSSAYLGNQYAIDGIDKDFYMKRLEEHLHQEEGTWLSVNNILRPKDVSPKAGEDLIIEWNWQEKLAKNAAKEMETKKHLPVWSLLSAAFSPNELSAQLVHSLTAVCSEGQNLIPIDSFNVHLVYPLLIAIQKRFKENFEYDEKRLWQSVFSEYVRIFLEDDVAREHTHREWWEICCRRCDISPSFHFPYTTYDFHLISNVGSALSQLVFNSCTFPSVKANRSTEFRQAFKEESSISPEPLYTPTRMVAMDARLFDLFLTHPFRSVFFPTYHLHHTIPPRPWVDFGVGGPWFCKSDNIVRNLADFREMSNKKEMISRLKSPEQARPIFDALNQLGSTPWRINKDLLQVLKQIFSMSYNQKNEPLLRPLAVPMHASTIDVPNFEEHFPGMSAIQAKEKYNDKYREYAKQTGQAVKKRNESNSLWCWMLYRVVLAEHFSESVLFFPHNMDFRGRVYPISPYLSHMGDDVSRSLLKFAKGRPLGKDGMRWLKLHCINLTGKMKRASIADREEEAERLIPLIIDSADRPLDGDRWWMESEEPWQTLATCYEIRDALRHPNCEHFISTLPIHQDGSCNGLQHYAAMGRDREGGEQVNLVPSERPNDVYSDVAVRVEQKRMEDERREGTDNESDIARRLREAMPGSVPRKVIKQTVMTTVYGVTMFGAVQQIKRQLKALDIDNDDTHKFASYLAKKTFASLNDVFTSSMQLKDWFRSCAKSISSLLRPVEWVTPLGLPVVQPYVKAQHQDGKLFHKPVSTKQVDAFPPNFVHSLDSTHMMLTSLHCARRGITYASVHDCFWTHACSVTEMNEICREQFIALHSLPLVQRCADYFTQKYLPSEMVETLPPEMLDKMHKLFKVQVKPGSLDLKEIRNSVYFFS